MGKKISRIIAWVLCILFALILIGNIYIILTRAITGKPQPRFLGFSVARIVSGSMSGEIEVNDMILTQKKRDYEIGDIVMYEADSRAVTHRIVEITPEGFITKGDANNTADASPVTEEQIVGKVILIIPKAGNIIGFMRSPMGLLSLVLIAALIAGWSALFRKREGKE